MDASTRTFTESQENSLLLEQIRAFMLDNPGLHKALERLEFGEVSFEVRNGRVYRGWVKNSFLCSNGHGPRIGLPNTGPENT